VALILLLLLLPKPWSLALFKPKNVIELEIVKPQPIPTNTPKPIQQPLEKPIIEEVIPKTKAKTVDLKAESTQQNTPALKSQEQITVKPSTTPKINTGDVLQMIQDRPSFDLPNDFQARSKPAKDFYIPEQEVHDWLTDLPYLDESIDKPKLQMKFYPEGIDGSIEKFFDKITISKTFTTKYGTKINCALIGVLVACGWK